MNALPLLLTSCDENGILRLTLDDEPKRNALSEQMLSSLQQAFDEAARDKSVRVIILQATGKVFSAGHNLKEMTAAREHADKGAAYFEKILNACAKVMQTIVTCPKPVIAEVDGIATAAGCQLVASCDLAIASDRAQFSTPGVHIGLFCSTPMVALSRNLSHKHAMEMLLTGDMIGAVRAKEMGLVNDVVSSDKLAMATQEMARKIASKSSHTVAIGKGAFYKQSEMTLSAAYDYASQVMVANMLDYDAQEGISAFIEKRAAKWQDR